MTRREFITRAKRVFGVVIVFIGFACRIPEPVLAAEKLGIVLMHGKDGLPGQMSELANALQAAGFLVDYPEMCWSQHRIYDRTYIDCLRDADDAASKLKGEGATGIVIAGVGLGGNAALAYGARRDELSGVIALRPAPPIEFLNKRPAIAKSLADAQELIAAGRGDHKAIFADFLLNRPFEVKTTANIYVSFFASDSPGIMPDNSSRLKSPLLVISGAYDPTQRSVPYVFARAPVERLNWHVTVPADPRGTVALGRDVMVAWLKLIAARGSPRN